METMAPVEQPPLKKRKEKKDFSVLYVDDEISNLRIFKISFRRIYNVFIAESAKEAIEILKQEKIHLIITDQKMPEMTGTQLLESIVDEYPEMIKMILTGFSDIESIAKAVNKCGIYKYMTKPYDQGELRLNIDQGLQSFNLKEEKNSLLDQLALANKDLEKKVEERTEELSRVNMRLTEGLGYAQTVQKYLIPSDEELAEFFGDAFSVYRPKDHVSGDFYWFHKINDNEAVLSMVDCMGHGVSAALLTMVGDSLLSQIVKDRSVYRPSQVLTDLDNGLKRTFNHEQTGAHESMDVSVIYVNKKAGVMEFSGAKSDIVYLKEGEETRLRGTKKSIGSTWSEDLDFENHRIDLDGVSEFYLFSDGYVDQTNGETFKKVGIKKLLELIKQSAGKESLDQKQAFDTYLDEWQQGTEQVDDVTLVGLKLSNT